LIIIIFIDFKKKSAISQNQVLGLGGKEDKRQQPNIAFSPGTLHWIFRESIFKSQAKLELKAGGFAGGLSFLNCTYCTRDLGGARRVSTPFGITNAVPSQSQHALSLPDHPRPEHPPLKLQKRKP
jgi:hypothetical protein